MRPGFAALVALGLLLVRPGLAGDRATIAAGHADLLASVPAEGDRLSVAPARIRLAFAEAIDPAFSSLDLLAADGRLVLDHAGSPDPQDGRILAADLPALGVGVYQVRWRSLSTGDGHAAFGSYSFGVGAGASGFARSTGSVDQVVTAGHGGHGDTLGRTLGYLGAMLGFGLGPVAWVVVRPSLRRTPVRLANFGAGVLVLAAFGSALQLLLEAGDASQAMRGPFDPLEFAFGSQAGQRLLLRIAASAAFAGWAWLLAQRRPAKSIQISAAGGGLGIVLIALSGHAAGSGSAAAVAVDLVHLVAASIWLTGVVLLAMAAVGRRGRRLPRRLLRAAVPRFTAVALVAVSVIAASGILQAWQESAALLPAGDSYGRTLILKIAIFLVAVGLGAANTLDGGRGRPWLGGTRDRLAFEAYGAIFVVVAAAILAADTPSGLVRPVELAPAVASAAVGVPAAAAPATASMGLGLRPGRPGPNHYVLSVPEAYPEGTTVSLEFHAAAAAGAAEAAGAARAASGAMSPPQPPSVPMRLAVGPGPSTVSYVADGDQLAPNSRWTIDVVVRDGAGADVARQPYTVAMGSGAITEGREVPSIDASVLLAGILVLLGAVAVGLGLLGRRLPRADRGASRWAFTGGGIIAAALGTAVLVLPR